MTRTPFSLFELGSIFTQLAQDLPDHELLKVWKTKSELTSRKSLLLETCVLKTPGVPSKFTCISATYNLHSWNSTLLKLVRDASGKKLLYNLVSDPTEKRPIRSKALMSEMVKLRSELRKAK